MSVRRILSVPVSDELGNAVRLAAQGQGVTVSAWVRDRLLTALRHPAAPGPPLSKADERKIWRLMSLPQLYTAAQLRAAGEERDDLRERLTNAFEEIRQLRAKVVGNVNQAAVPRETSPPQSQLHAQRR